MSNFRNRAFGGPRHAPPRLYPVVQWNHGRGGQGGGLELPTRHFQDPTALDLPAPVEVAHSEGSEEAWVFPTFHFAPAGWKPPRWERRCGQIVETAPPELAEPWKAGYRSRRQVIGIIKELWEAGYHGFVVLSVRATASQDLARVLGQAARFRQAAGQSASGVAFPEYAFWIPIAAGKPERATNQDGQASLITPIVALLPEKPAEEDFSTLLISQDVQAFIEARLGEVAEWETGTAGVPVAAPPAPPAGEPLPMEEESPAAPEEKTAAEDPTPVGRPPRRERRAAPPEDFLRMTVPFGTKEHPEFRGQPLGDLLSTPAGRMFVNYLAYRHKPKNEAQEVICRAARILSTVGFPTA